MKVLFEVESFYDCPSLCCDRKMVVASTAEEAIKKARPLFTDKRERERIRGVKFISLIAPSLFSFVVVLSLITFILFREVIENDQSFKSRKNLSLVTTTILLSLFNLFNFSMM